ncbi:MAG: hypothetical protein ACXW19_01400 [Thermoanaerobaculia bacterium]
MRSVNVAFRVVVIAAVFTVSAVGQQPTATVLPDPSPSIDLPVEPVHPATPMTLSDAAQRNDFPAFAMIYADSEPREAASFAEFDGFWKWSLTDPVGGFYGADMHARLAARYPDYEPFIADHRIVDARGNSFYPSSETRAFLLKKAVSGAAAKVASVRQPEAVPRRVSVEKPAPALVPQRATVSVQEPVSSPAQQRASAAVATPTQTARSAGEDTGAPLRTAPAPLKTSVAPADDARFARGFALFIAGLIGLGMLTVMLRTPAEERPKEMGEQVDSMEAMRIIKLERTPPAKESGSHSSAA